MKSAHPNVWSLAARVFALCAVCLCLEGCNGQRRATAVGKITLSGEPLESGMVTFRPKSGASNEAFTLPVANGKYATTTPVAVGDYFVEVQAWKKTGRMVRGQFDREIEEVIPLIPARYTGPQTELSARLAAGKNEVDFALEP
jgi:hypothetical protein